MLLSRATTEGIAHKCVSVGWCMRLDDDKHIHTDTDNETAIQKWHQRRRQRRKCIFCVVCWDTVHVHRIVCKVQPYRRTPSNIVRAQYRSHWGCSSIYLCISFGCTTLARKLSRTMFYLLDLSQNVFHKMWLYFVIWVGCIQWTLFNDLFILDACVCVSFGNLTNAYWTGTIFNFRYLLWKCVAVV